jgi:hypothetical protein
MTNQRVRFNEGSPRAVPRGVPFPFRGHRPLSHFSLNNCQRCGVRMSKAEMATGVLCALCSGPQRPETAA